MSGATCREMSSLTLNDAWRSVVAALRYEQLFSVVARLRRGLFWPLPSHADYLTEQSKEP